MKIGPDPSVGHAVVAARHAGGLSQVDLARVLDVSPFVINNVEAGRRAFDTDWLSRMPSDMAADIRSALGRLMKA